MKTKIWRLMPLLMFGLLVAFFWRGLSLDPQRVPAAKMGQSLPVFDLPSLLDPQTQRFTPQLMQGHQSLLIVWASWCEACQEEQLFLEELSQQGVRLYGLNYKDDPLAARQWLKDWGNPYQAIGMDRRGKLAMDLGVYGAPEAYLVDDHGVIQYRHAGALTPDVWQRDFLPRMTKLRG
ncbi:MAG: DsbE family thiol:disulfide interchange protein [Legionella sp.]|nr:MAG: DsbE family thiol:disulfide interchange protein [Legionella sp.]